MSCNQSEKFSSTGRGLHKGKAGLESACFRKLFPRYHHLMCWISDSSLVTRASYLKDPLGWFLRQWRDWSDSPSFQLRWSHFYSFPGLQTHRPNWPILTIQWQSNWPITQILTDNDSACTWGSSSRSSFSWWVGSSFFLLRCAHHDPKTKFRLCVQNWYL